MRICFFVTIGICICLTLSSCKPKTPVNNQNTKATASSSAMKEPLYFVITRKEENSSRDILYRYNVASGKAEEVYQAPNTIVAIGQQNKHFAMKRNVSVDNYEYTISDIDGTNQTSITVESNDNSAALAILHDRRLILVKDNSSWLFEDNQQTLLQAHNDGISCVSPEGSTLAYTHGRGKLSTYKLDRSGENNTYKVSGITPFYIDSQTVVCTSNLANGVKLYTLKLPGGSTTSTLITVPKSFDDGYANGPHKIVALSADGSYIAIAQLNRKRDTTVTDAEVYTYYYSLYIANTNDFEAKLQSEEMIVLGTYRFFYASEMGMKLLSWGLGMGEAYKARELGSDPGM